MSIELSQLPESGNHLGRITPFGDISHYPTEHPVECARLLWDRGFAVVPFRIWNDGTKTHKMPLAKSWKPYRLKWSEVEVMVRKSQCFGIVVPAGFIVVDLDAPSKMFEGLHNLLDLSEEHLDNLDFMNTLTVNTPSGGSHLWYRVPPSLQFDNSASSLAQSVDIRVAGKGLILMPPSIALDSCYSFDLNLGTVDVARAPWWLIRDLSQPFVEPEARKTKHYNFDGSPENVKRYLKKRGEAIAGAMEGNRNHILNAVAYGIYKRVSEGKIELELAEDVIYDNAIACGLDDREIRATMNSAKRAAT